MLNLQNLVILIIILVVYFYYKKNKFNNNEIKKDIDELMGKASSFSYESENIKEPILKYEKSIFGITYLKILMNKYSEDLLKKNCDFDFIRFKNKIIKNYLHSKKIIFEKCHIDEHKTSYLQDITYKL